MHPPDSAEYLLRDETQASRFGAALGLSLRAGDCVLLEGPVGAGKSHIARAAIRAIAGAEIDVPSPTFTLVQTYPGPGCEIWHADLYRLTDHSEVLELGLEEAMESAITMIEWPDRLGPWRPDGGILLRLAPEGDVRRVQVFGARLAILRALDEALA